MHSSSSIRERLRRTRWQVSIGNTWPGPLHCMLHPGTHGSQSGQWRESPSLLQPLADAALHSPPRRTASRPRSPTAWSCLFLCLQTSGRSGTRRRVPGNARHAFVHCFDSLFVFLQTSGRSGMRRRVPAPCTCSASTRVPSSMPPSKCVFLLFVYHFFLQSASISTVIDATTSTPPSRQSICAGGCLGLGLPELHPTSEAEAEPL